MLVELKSGDTYNGLLAASDNFMNLCLRDVICASPPRRERRRAPRKASRAAARRGAAQRERPLSRARARARRRL